MGSQFLLIALLYNGKICIFFSQVFHYQKPAETGYLQKLACDLMLLEGY